jgi:hypothetical protein
MNEFIVRLTDAELKALAATVLSPEDWINNAVKEMCRRSMQEIFSSEVEKMISDPSVSEIPADIETVVLNAEILPVSETLKNQDISQIV